MNQKVFHFDNAIFFNVEPNQRLSLSPAAAAASASSSSFATTTALLPSSLPLPLPPVISPLAPHNLLFSPPLASPVTIHCPMKQHCPRRAAPMLI